MLQAMLHGKLSPEEERLEDLLTSNIFGLLKYLPCELILLPFLSLSRNPLSSNAYLKDWLKDVSCVEKWEFWKTLNFEGCYLCEPDLIIHLRDDKHEDWESDCNWKFMKVFGRPLVEVTD